VTGTESQPLKQETRTSWLAIISFILGIAGIWTLGLSALVGIILGVFALLQIRTNEGKMTGRVFAILGIIVSGFAIAAVYFVVVAAMPRYFGFRMICAHNLRQLGKSLRIYSNNYDGEYPAANKWGDLLVEHAGAGGTWFYCKGIREERYHFTINPREQFGSPWHQSFFYHDPNGRSYYVKHGHYAINPNAEPNSPRDMVLLFETKGGWNQFGGPELVSFDNHRGEGCNILFNNGDINFVTPDEVGKLKWK